MILDSSNDLLQKQGKKRKHEECEQYENLIETLTIMDDETPAVCEESNNAKELRMDFITAKTGAKCNFFFEYLRLH